MLLNIKKLVNNMSVGQKVLTVIFLEIISYTVVTAVALIQINNVGNVVKQMSDLQMPLYSSIESVRLNIQESRLNLKDIIFIGDRVVYDKQAEESYIYARAKYQENVNDIYNEIDWADQLITKSTKSANSRDNLIEQYSNDLQKILISLRDANREYNTLASKVFNHIEDGSFLMGLEIISQVENSERDLNENLDLLVSELGLLRNASVSYALEVESIASKFTILASIITICIVITIFFFVVKRNITTPLHSLTDTINSISALHDVEDSEIEKELMTRGDELGMVSRSFNKLKHDLSAQDKDLRIAKEDAEKANRAKSQFLAAASHDLRQPLHAMQMYTTVLKQKIRNKDTLKIITDIEEVSVSTGRLLNAILDVSKLEAGSVKPQIEVFSIKELLNRIARNYKPISYKKGLGMSIHPCSLYIKSDPILLEQVLGNFISNAIRYTESGRVVVGCRRRNNKVAIEVHDSGPGIPSMKQSVIFNDFYQLHNRERDRDKGLGLGLGIVRRLSECLGHEIEHSSKLKKGSKFSVIVDTVSIDNMNQAYFNAEVISLHSLKNTKIFLIEDDEIVLHSTQLLLESWGCIVSYAKTAREAIKFFESHEYLPDVMIVDFRLPDMNGKLLVEKIDKIKEETIPTFFVTGEAEPEEIAKLLDNKYFVLSKPVHPAKLRSLISNMVENKNQQPLFSAGNLNFRGT
ncbi:MAG: ATP-binding protein [Pseudomonadota bacterium]